MAENSLYLCQKFTNIKSLNTLFSRIDHACGNSCMRFGFSRTTYYKVYEAFIQGGIPSLMGRPRGRPQPIKVNEIVLGYLIAEKAKNPKLSASEMVTNVMNRYNVQISVRMIQHVWKHYSVSKKK